MEINAPHIPHLYQHYHSDIILHIRESYILISTNSSIVSIVNTNDVTPSSLLTSYHPSSFSILPYSYSLHSHSQSHSILLFVLSILLYDSHFVSIVHSFLLIPFVILLHYFSMFLSYHTLDSILPIHHSLFLISYT